MQVLEKFSRNKDDRIAEYEAMVEAMVKHEQREYSHHFGRKKSHGISYLSIRNG